MLSVALIGVTFREGLAFLVQEWDREEYSYGYLVPFIAFYLLLLRVEQIRESVPKPSWVGIGVVMLGVTLALAGRLSIVYILIQYGLILVLVGLILARAGWRVLWLSAPPLICLLFMIPLPRFVYAGLSAELQLISSTLGVGFLRMVGIPVFLDGNVIDLGSYKLQVVEACSGLRYLFPLMTFGYVCAMLFKAPLWQRLLVFFVTIPIAVFMNSFRIGVTGVLVARFGTEQAEGFLHYFEGWIIFASCLLLLFAIMSALTRLGNRRLDDVFDTNIPTAAQFRSLLPTGPVTAPFAIGVVVLALATAGSVLVEQRVQMIPASASVSAFPLRIGEWQGTSLQLDADTLTELQVTDYFVGGYRSPQHPEGIELYVAYYAAQNSGVVIHSPRGCLPGGGWEIASSDIRSIPDMDAEGQALRVNRVVIGKGTERSLVYYWFAQRGRNLTNEYLVKWFLFWDAATINRSDGALVRLVTPVRDQADIEAADRRMEVFLRGAYPRLVYQLPQRSTVLIPEPAGR